MTGGDQQPRRPNGDFDTKVAYSARVNNYWHGGKDNFAKDREAAEQALEAFPELPVAVRAGVRFRTAAVTMLVQGDDPPSDGMVQEAGLRQFLDLGTGLPAGDPIHRIAQGLVPACRAVCTSITTVAGRVVHARVVYGGPMATCDASEFEWQSVRVLGAGLAAHP